MFTNNDIVGRWSSMLAGSRRSNAGSNPTEPFLQYLLLIISWISPYKEEFYLHRTIGTAPSRLRGGHLHLLLLCWVLSADRTSLRGFLYPLWPRPAPTRSSIAHRRYRVPVSVMMESTNLSMLLWDYVPRGYFVYGSCRLSCAVDDRFQHLL